MPTSLLSCDSDCAPKKIQQLLELAHKLFPHKKVAVEYLGGGAFNVVAKITCKSQQYILRVPRNCETKEMDYQTTVAVTSLLNLPVPVPRVIAHGTNKGTQWMLMTCLKGLDMTRSMYDQLPTQQACHIAKKVAEVLYHLSKIRFASCGSLVYDQHGLTVEKPLQPHSAPTTLKRFLEQRFQTIIANAQHNIQGAWTMFDIFAVVFVPYLQTMISQMTFLEDQEICLFHPDLHSHNFLFLPAPKNQSPCRFEDKHGTCKRKRCPFVHRGGKFANPELTGILDWDNCEALPAQLAFRAPTWLWNTEKYHGSSWDTDDAVYFIGENPCRVTASTNVDVRNAFFAEIERLVPGFTNVVRTSYNSGLLVLGSVARFGITPGTAGLTRCLLRRNKLEDEAQQQFETLHFQLEQQK